MIAMDSQTGKEVANLPTAEGMDGVYFDAKRKRIYISGGRAADAGERLHLSAGCPGPLRDDCKNLHQTWRWNVVFSPELDRYYVAAPSSDKQTAAILVFEPQP